jgi:translation initiation factor 1
MRDRPKFHVERGEPLSTTQQGRICPTCARPKRACECRPAAQRPHAPAQPAVPADGIVRVSRQTKGRKGKGVTLVTGLRLPPAELDALCKGLKQRCGAGGTVRDGVIEIQGDHRDALVAALEAAGHTVKRAGG